MVLVLSAVDAMLLQLKTDDYVNGLHFNSSRLAVREMSFTVLRFRFWVLGLDQKIEN